MFFFCPILVKYPPQGIRSSTVSGSLWVPSWKGMAVRGAVCSWELVCSERAQILDESYLSGSGASEF